MDRQAGFLGHQTVDATQQRATSRHHYPALN
jgi:hypothetical protein